MSSLQVACFAGMLLAAVSTFAGAETGWHGEINGRVNGTLDGPGRFFCIDSMPMASSRAPASLVIADGGRAGRYGVTISVPRDTSLGKHPIAPSTAWETGRVIEFRVDVMRGYATESFGTKPVGFLIIEALPDGSARSAGRQVRGSYDIRVENTAGESVHASGSFSFLAPTEVSTDPRKQWYCKDPLPR